MSKQTDLINIPDAITVSGSNVGIGTSSPSADLDIKRTAGDNNDILRVGSTDNYYHGFARSNTTGALSIQGNQTNFNNILLAPTSGNVGIGTSTPRTESGATTLEVSDSTTARAIIKSTGTGGREYGWYSSTAGQFGLYDYTANTERMRIDSSGNVTTPNQPAFFASSTSADINISSTTATNFNVTRVNVGNHYSTSTKRFTAPVSGTYYFECVIQIKAVSTGAQIHALGVGLLKNGNSVKDQYHGNSGTTNYITVNCNAIIYMNQSDFVTSRIQPGTSIDIEYSGGTDRCHFSGYLIG
jgi:hypothetical protein